ncbi:TorF family putative porin [Aliarcobacter butzleri]|uniref:TorF family putative porin n=2 Tax=Aliarcobacter butzleri TaxID=28197 RepID=UPI00125FDFCA|nr:TorF family putative porin [Aliarcobacter butzleri]MCG3655790.1 TorF family putative porin [Aliarcobacter butzleri]MCG3677616.1 TorF family putative porin [Aliarcobacter butzleri]MDK2051192.1 TorF family putative porin [Aliarcobacter butzleri]
MKKMNSIVLSSALLISTIACANEIDTAFGITGTSNYLVRGMTQTNDKAALFLEGTVLYNGFFTGAWTSNIDFEGTDANREIDLYAGYSKDIFGFETTLTYTKFLYNSKDIADMDEVEIKVVYPFDKFSIGGKYIFGTYVENDGKKLDYYEGFTSYDFDIVTLKGSTGSYEDTGDNFEIGISKSFELSKGSLSLELLYSEFYSDNSSSLDEENLYAKVIYSF